ncbi:MAG: HAD family hydrolase [Spirochaetia bacterium]|nr:HAD family hydrolase [Spirochaetia bacterium]
MHNTIIFDLDGTLVDTSKGIFATANYTMRELGYEELSDAQLRKFVGPPLAVCFRVACGLDEELILPACDIYRKEYAKGNMYLGEVYPGIVDLLTTLKTRNISLGVATLKHEDVAIEILKNKGLFNYFDTIRGSSTELLLSKADIIELALEDLHIEDTSKVIMVGDTPHDLDGALSVGVDFVAVDWGFGFQKGHILEIAPRVLGTIDKEEQLLRYL